MKKIHSKNRLIFILFIVLYLFQANLNAQNAYRNIIYNAYINGDMQKWSSVIYTMEKEQNSSIDKKLELLNYLYGYTGYLVGLKKTDLANKYIQKGEQLISIIIAENPENATVYAYKGSFIGFKIGLSHFKAIYLGPESNSAIDKCLKIDSQNIQGLLDKANALYHTPSIFGGDKNASLKIYLKAIKLIEINNHVENNWLYLNALTLAARNYEILGKPVPAKLLYEKILQFEPDFKWVKNELLPQINKKILSAKD